MSIPTLPMKQSLPRRRWSRLSSFTLLELLVVMGIIAILAGVSLSVFILVINSAKRAKAQNLANQIQTAAYGYYTEYSVYPIPTGTTTDYTIPDTSGSANQTAWGNLICCLCGNIQPYAPGTAIPTTTITNSRGIAFLTLKGSDVDSGNAPLNPLPTGTEIYFYIAINSSYSGVLGTNAPTSTVMPNFAAAPGSSTTLSLTGGTSTAGVAVWANCTGKTTITNAADWAHTY